LNQRAPADDLGREKANNIGQFAETLADVRHDSDPLREQVKPRR
jgi:hypothetical protein